MSLFVGAHSSSASVLPSPAEKVFRGRHKTIKGLLRAKMLEEDSKRQQQHQQEGGEGAASSEGVEKLLLVPGLPLRELALVRGLKMDRWLAKVLAESEMARQASAAEALGAGGKGTGKKGGKAAPSGGKASRGSAAAATGSTSTAGGGDGNPAALLGGGYQVPCTQLTKAAVRCRDFSFRHFLADTSAGLLAKHQEGMGQGVFVCIPSPPALFPVMLVVSGGCGVHPAQRVIVGRCSGIGWMGGRTR